MLNARLVPHNIKCVMLFLNNLIFNLKAMYFIVSEFDKSSMKGDILKTLEMMVRMCNTSSTINRLRRRRDGTHKLLTLLFLP